MNRWLILAMLVAMPAMAQAPARPTTPQFATISEGVAAVPARTIPAVLAIPAGQILRIGPRVPFARPGEYQVPVGMLPAGSKVGDVVNVTK